MPLTAAFSFRLKDQILENTACVGLYDGERPTLTAATTGGKIFMFDPYARADEHGSDAGGASRVRYLNINKKITAVAAGALGAAAFTVPGAFAEALTQTPKMAEGPFYPDKLPLDTDNDLIVVNDSLNPSRSASVASADTCPSASRSAG